MHYHVELESREMLEEEESNLLESWRRRPVSVVGAIHYFELYLAFINGRPLNSINRLLGDEEVVCNHEFMLIRNDSNAIFKCVLDFSIGSSSYRLNLYFFFCDLISINHTCASFLMRHAWPDQPRVLTLWLIPLVPHNLAWTFTWGTGRHNLVSERSCTRI